LPRRIRRTFRWVAPIRNTKWSVSIKGIDVTDFILAGTFPHGIISEELISEIELDNSGENFTDKFAARDPIVFLMDFTNGTTVQFRGEVEEVKSQSTAGAFKLSIKGAHFTNQLLDIMVTEEFTNATVPSIRKSLITNYFTGQSVFSIQSATAPLTEEDGGLEGGGNIIEPGFTQNNISDDVVTPEYDTIDIKFVNKPLLDCLLELDIQGDEDTYIDFDKDFHSFKQESNLNDNEAVVWDDSLIDLIGLGTDSADVRNRVIVYGEAGGLPVIRTSEDTTSQETFRTKEKVITGTNIESEAQADTLAQAERIQLENPRTQGSARTFFMPQLNPGDMIYIISPPHNIHARFRLVKFVFNVPSETMELFFNKERTVSKLFKERVRKDLDQEVIVNPNRMSNSYNFGSDGGFIENKIDGEASDSVEVIDGNLQLQGAVESANMISITKNTPRTVNSVEIRVLGESLKDTNYYVNADGTNTFQKITLDTETQVTNSGKKLRFRIEFNTATARVRSAVVLYK